jgi:PTH2 family peptidyl-tRNA hydrolase
MIIVMRKDLNMRKGKMIAQGCHASMSFLTREMGVACNIDDPTDFGADVSFGNNEKFAIEVDHWLKNSFRKICVYVNSEEELEAVHQKALDSGLISHLIIDNGKTEFNGVKTKTCCAIGPHTDEKFEGITDHLPLF